MTQHTPTRGVLLDYTSKAARVIQNAVPWSCGLRLCSYWKVKELQRQQITAHLLAFLSLLMLCVCSKYECAGDAAGIYAYLGYYPDKNSNRLVYIMKNYRDCQRIQAEDQGKNCPVWCGWGSCCFMGFPCSHACGCQCRAIVCAPQNLPVGGCAVTGATTGSRTAVTVRRTRLH